MINFPDLSLWQFVFCSCVTIFAGFAKGLTGFALPMIMVSGMAIVIDPKLAIASMVLPTIVSNAWQSFQQGGAVAWNSLKKFWLLIFITLAMIYIHAQWIGALNFDNLLAILGVSIALVSLVQLLGFKLKLDKKNAGIATFITAQIAGFFGAIAGTWGPPITIYLLAIDTPKAEQIRVSGIAFGLGALMFWFAHERSGLMNPQALGLSFLMLFPMIIGLYFGTIAQAKIDQKRFRQFTLWLLLISGLNILRKAMMG